MPKNIKLLKAVAKKIKQRPNQFNMDHFFCSVNQAGDSASHCGTAACIAGWIVTLGAKCKTPKDAFEFRRGGSTHKLGRELAGLTERQASNLFYTSEWPAKFKKAFGIDVSLTAKEYASVAVKRINHFIKTGK